MRQAHLVAPRTIEWRERPSPAPRHGEILVDVRAALTCGTDLKSYRRGHPKLRYGPFGHEASGDVASVGPGVERFAPGDAVMWVQTAPCLACAPCLRGSENLCDHLFDDIALGAYGDRLLLPAKVVERNLFRKPAHLTYVEAAFLEPFACVVHGWNVLRRANAARPVPQSVAIIGAGTIGLLHAIYTARAGVPATIIGRGKDRLALAARLGSTEIIDADDADATSAQRGRFDAVVECAGSERAWRQALDLARAGGRVLFFSGLPEGSEVAIDATRLHYAELTALGSFHFTPADVREAFELLSWGGIDVRPLVSGVERLDRLEQIFERLDRRDGYKFALIPGAADARWV